jgi:hypothetical protein
MKAAKIILVLAAGVLFLINANAVPDLSIGEFAPRGPQVNLYTYVANNPVNEIDPFGLQAAAWVDQNGNNVWWGSYNQTTPGYTFQLTPYNQDLPSGWLWGTDQNGNPAPYEMGLQDDPLGNILLGGIGPALRGSAVRMCPASRLTFGTEHALPHFEGTWLSQSAIENSIQNELESQFGNFPTTVEGPFMGRIPFQGQTIEFRGFGLPNGTINIGTYYPK